MGGAESQWMRKKIDVYYVNFSISRAVFPNGTLRLDYFSSLSALMA